MSSDQLVFPEGAKRPPMDRVQVMRVAVNLAVVCALAAIVLGAIYMGTERYAAAARLAGEQRAITGLLELDDRATVTEVEQFLSADGDAVVYRARPYGDEAATPREVVFGLDGALRPASPPAAPGAESAALTPLGRLFVASVDGATAGFVVEGESRGYKKRIRFFVALDSALTIRGVRVLEHEEDPGLGAEIATPWFQGQYVGRTPEQIAAMDVTKDPMPEDWRAALGELARTPAGTWRERNAALVGREGSRPIYAVTGATISSRALTRGVRTTLDHFRRRWALLEPHLGGPA
jgi:electron transport complex protein RnfG